MSLGGVVGADLEREPIDAVVTWVDGADPDHHRKKVAALREIGKNRSAIIPAGIDQTRFEDNNEVELCVRSIRKFAPWVRKIYLVTDQQCPRFLTDAVRLKLGVSIVDHREIFSGLEFVLPTFNSLSIETVLHRIPGLAEKYIYLNDDFILLAQTSPYDFFTRDGVVLRGKWRKIQRYGKARVGVSKVLNLILKRMFGINRAMSVLQQIRGAQLAGVKHRYFNVSHSPYPIQKRTLEHFFLENHLKLVENSSPKFRSFDQYATTSLANHLEILSGTARCISSEESIMICFNRDVRRDIDAKIEKVGSSGIRFLCLQSVEQAELKDRARIRSKLAQVLG